MRYSQRKFLLAALCLACLSQVALSAEPGGQTLASTQCLRRAENGPAYPLVQIDDSANFAAAVEQIVAACQANPRGYAVALEGQCADGRKLLNIGSGFTNTLMLYTATGEFESRIFQTDAQSPPCMGQFAWPSYQRCEAPVIVRNFCGRFQFESDDPAFYDRWTE